MIGPSEVEISIQITYFYQSVGRNLWMIYCKAPFDPELSASTSSNYYMNVDYFMQPSLRNFGFNVKVQF